MTGSPFEPVLPFELVEATEHHGLYICTAFGTTVCDFYAMTDPSSMSVRNGGTSRPVSFTDAAENASFMVRAANAYGEMMAALKAAIDPSVPFGEAMTKIHAAIAAAEARS